MDERAQADFAAWLARHPATSSAREEFRRSARAAFLSVAASLPVRRKPRIAAHMLALSLAAAAILVVTLWLPKPERWSTRLEGPVRLAGVEYLPGQEERLGAALAGAGTVEATSRTRLSWAELFDMELLAGAELSFPALSELDGVTPIRFELVRGEAFLRTTNAYPGNPIVIHTPTADVYVHGTTLGVLVCAEGTCVCVAEGTVAVRSEHLPGNLKELGARQTLFVYGGGVHPAQVKGFPVDPAAADHLHTQALLAFRDVP